MTRCDPSASWASPGPRSETGGSGRHTVPSKQGNSLPVEYWSDPF